MKQFFFLVQVMLPIITLCATLCLCAFVAKKIRHQKLKPRQPRCTANRMPRKGTDMPKYRIVGKRLHVFIRTDKSAKRQPTTQCFSQQQDIRHHTILFKCPKGSGASIACLYFIKYQQSAGLVTLGANGLKPFRICSNNPGLCLHHLHYHTGRLPINEFNSTIGIVIGMPHIGQQRTIGIAPVFTAHDA